MSLTNNINLKRDDFGRLVLTAADGAVHTGVLAVRAFPISAPNDGVSLVDADGHELAWFDHLSDLPADMRQLVQDALVQREFMPTLKRLISVSSFATPSTWDVETDHGPTRFVLKGEEDIRRLSPGVLMVADMHGVQYLIRDLPQMDKHSRKLLDRFM